MSEELFFDRYVLKEPPLGEGGMGKVYEAYDQKLGRRVAIKIMRPEYAANNESRRRFYWEASSAARFGDCSNIVTIFDYDVAEGNQPFISMECLEGQDLKTRMQESSPLERPANERSAFSFREKLETIVQVCRGLARAHSGDVFHRDIKPANIFIAREGPVKILDFGVARILDSTLTRENVALGTLAWMPPEQLMGKPVDGRSDIWSTGVVLYELLCHRLPFAGDSVALPRRILSEAYPPLTRYLPACAEELEEVVDRALAKDPAQRFRSANDMANSLEECIRLLPSKEPELRSEIENLQNLLRNWRSESCDLPVPAILEGSVFMGEEDPDQTVPVWGVDYGTLLERHYEIFGWWQLIKDHPDRVAPVFELLSKSTREFEVCNIPACLESLKQVRSLDSRNAHVEMLEVECGWILGQPFKRRKELIVAKVRGWRAEQEKLEIYLKTRAILEEANTYLREKDYQAGLEAVEKLLTLSPEHPEGLRIKSLAEEALERLGEVEEALSWAKAAFKAGDYWTCVEATDKGLGLEPEHDEIKKLNQLAKDALEKSRQVEDLIQQAEQALETTDYTLVLLLVREVLSLEPDHEEAVRIHDQAKGALERQRRIEELVVSARAAVQAQDPETCLKATTEALELDSGNVELLALQQQAQEILDLRGKVEESLLRAKQTLQAEDFKTALQLADEVLNLRAEDEEALNVQKTARAALERKERIAELLTSGQAAFEAGEYRTSLRLTQQGLKLDPENSELGKLRGRSQEALDKIQTIKELLAQAHQLLDENDEKGVFQIVEEVLALDSQNLEASQLKKEIAARSENREREQKVLVLLAAAQEAHQAGNYESCLRSTREALALAPDHPEIKQLDRLAIEALETNRKVEALLKEARKALKAKDYPSAAETAQKALELQPEDEYALQICREAAEALESQEKISELLQEAHEYYSSQDHENVLKVAQEGLQIDPRHPEFRKLQKRSEEALEKSRSIEKLLAEAREALKEENYPFAQKCARDLLILASDHPEALQIEDTALQGVQRQARLKKILALAQKSLEKRSYPTCLKEVQEGLKISAQNEDLLSLQRRAQEALDKIQTIKELLAQGHQLLEANDEKGVFQIVEAVLALDSRNLEASQLKKEIAARSENREREQKVLVLLAAAQEAHQAGNYEACLRSTREALALAPDHPEIKQLDRLAIEALETNRRVEALLREARNALKAKDYPSAAETAQKALELQPEDEYALQICREAAEALESQERISELLEKANEYWASQDYENCLEAVQEGLQIDPRHPELRKLRKQAQEILEKNRKTEQLLGEAREALQDKDYSVTQKRARAILKLESDHPEALRISETAEKGARRQRQLNKILTSAQQFLEKKQYQNCLEQVQEGLGVEPQNEGLLRLQEQAQEALEKLQKIDALMEQAQELLKQKKDDSVLEKVRDILSLDPENTQAVQLRKKAVARLEARDKEERVSDLLAKAEQAYQQGEYKACLQATAELLVLAPDHSETKKLDQKAREAFEKEQQVEDLLARVQRFSSAENYRAALEAIEQALALQPDLGELREIRESTAKALRHQEKVNKLRTRARELYESGDYQSCLEACGEGLKIEPEERELLKVREAASEAIKREKKLAELLEQGRQARDQADFSRALGFSELALTIDPNHQEALRMQKGAKQEAERRQKTDSFLFSARQLFEEKEYSKCLQAVESGLKLEGENSELSELRDLAGQSLEKELRIGELLSEARKLFEEKEKEKDRKVVEATKEVLALDPQNSEGFQLLEKAQARIRARERKEQVDQLLARVREAYQAGEYRECLKASEEALALEPDDPELTEFQIRAQKELDQLEKQGRLLEAARKKLEAQDFSGAIDQAQAILLLKPRQPDALKIQQEAEEGLKRQRRVDELLTSAEAAFEVENHKTCLEAVAQGLEVQPEQVRLKQLQRLARRALQKREKTLNSLLEKARKQQELENFQKALTLSQDILALDPDHREAIEIQETAKEGIERLGPDLEPGLWEYASRPIAILAAILIMAFAAYQLFIAPARELSALVASAQELFEAEEYPIAQVRITEGLEMDPEHPDLLRLDVEVKQALEQAAVPTVAPGILSLNILPWAKVDSILRKDDKKEFADDPNNSCPESPCVVSLPPGEYHVKVSHPHFDSLEFDINISSGVFHTETRPLAGFNPDNEIPQIVGD